MSTSTKTLKFYFVLMLIFAGCTKSISEKKADVGLIANSYKTESNASVIGVAVPSTSGAVVPGSNPAYFVMRSSDRMLSEIAAIEFRRLLMEKNRYKVFTRDTRRAKYIVKVGCSEIVPDISQLKDKTRIPTLEAGTLIAAIGPMTSSSVSYLPAVGALIQSFEPLTGLALTKKNRERIGSVKIDVQILDRRGKILNAETFPASFAVRTAERGGITSTSNYKAVAASFAQDAVRAAVIEAVKNFENKVNSVTALPSLL